MGNSDRETEIGADKNAIESPDVGDENSLDHLLDKPLSTHEYFKLLFYFVIVVLVGALIAIVVFLVNK